MSLEQLMSLAQTLKLSPTLLQSMSILQMNTQELSDYLNDLALENPVMEYTEAPSGQLSRNFLTRFPGWGMLRPPQPPAKVRQSLHQQARPTPWPCW